MTHHPDVPRDRSHRRGLASMEGVRYIAFSLHGAGTSRWSRGRLEDSPSGLWRTLGKRVGCKPSGVRIPHPPPQFPLRSRDSRACELTEAHSDVACLRSLWSAPRRRERVAPRESTPPNSFAARRRAPAQTQHIGNRPDRTGERGRTAPHGLALPAGSGFVSAVSLLPGLRVVIRRRTSGGLQSVPASPTAPPCRRETAQCQPPPGVPTQASPRRREDREAAHLTLANTALARVAHSIMTYFQRNPGIKRKSKSTHHHPESPMCIDPLGAHGSRRPIAAPHRKPRNIREIWRLLRIVAFSHVQLRVAPPSNRAGRW